ncbi:hypothetical protein Tco_1043287 [Tanacetum coccineum]|uniref:Reverse transcriptase domain-containing protein n=1 Tax=Tanacetum coccineum TaxID=301880 RepID=A0ABQ5GLM4_9ASTR
MAPKKRTTRASPATTTTTTSVTNAQLKALIDKGIANALAARDANKSMNGDDNHNLGTSVRTNKPVAHECTYPDFINYQPLNFKGTKGVVELNQWTVGHDVAYAMTLTKLKKKMTDKYCPRSEIKKLETMQEAIEMVTKQMDKKILTFVERLTENKRKQDDNNNQTQQQPPKKQGVAISYTAWFGERKEYAGTLPLCNKYKFHHNGQCTETLTCYECGNKGLTEVWNCPEVKEPNLWKPAEVLEPSGVVHALGGGETNQDLNNMEG